MKSVVKMIGISGTHSTAPLLYNFKTARKGTTNYYLLVSSTLQSSNVSYKMMPLENDHLLWSY